MQLAARPRVMPPRCAVRHAVTCCAATPPPLPASRRAVLHAAAASALLLVGPPVRAGETQAEVEVAAATSSLEPLFTAAELPWPGPSFGYAKQLYYPDWLFGEWRVESKLVAFSTPRGEALAPRNAARAAAEDMQRAVRFRARFYSTLPDSASNSFRVALGALPQDAIMADRAFNCASLANATAAAAPGAKPDAPPVVSSVEYDPREAPDTMRVLYTGGGRAELFLSAMRADPLPEGAPPPSVFHTAECSRQTTLGVQRVDVSDYQILSRYLLQSPGLVTLRQRVGVYLTPQDEAYFSAINAAVALYDYDLTLEREERAGEGEGGGPLVCVQTPKDVVQCR